MPSPTIVIVPAACQTPAFYDPLSRALQKASFPVIVIPTPSVGVSSGSLDFTADATAVRKTVTGLLDHGVDVIVLMHSYGGMPGTQALEGLGKAEREKMGEKGGVVRLIYAASFALRKGETQPGAGDREALKKMAGEGFDEKAGILSLSPQAAMYALFHDLPTEEAEHWSSQLKPQSVKAIWSTQTYEAWKDIPSTYIVCEKDRVIQPEKQEEMIANARAVQPMAFDVVERLDCGHQPILSNVQEMVEIVKRAAKTT